MDAPSIHLELGSIAGNGDELIVLFAKRYKIHLGISIESGARSLKAVFDGVLLSSDVVQRYHADQTIGVRF